jgi:O-antigen/teichoic acid export membrane protein
MLSNVSRLAETLQVDRTLLYALAARIWQALSGPLTIVFIVRTLTQAEQGVYYAMVSIMNIQQFFELGLLSILISQAGHQASAIQQTRHTPAELAAVWRMSRLMRAAQRWFVMASLLYAISAFLVGWYTLSEKSVSIDWRWPLVFICLLAAATIAVSPRLAVLEGAGYRDSVYRNRLLQMILGASAIWIALLLNLGVWALVATLAVQLACSLALTQLIHADFFAQQATARPPDRQSLDYSQPSWLTEVLPMQWRMALISIAYFLATQLFTLITWQFDSPVAAGQLGMTLTVTSAIQGMAITWLQTKFAIISSLHGAGNREEAGNLWRRSAIVSTTLLATALVAAIALIASLRLFERGWETRFIAPWQIAVLGVGCLANHLVALQSFYVISRKGNPLLVAALIGLSTTGLAVLLGSYWYSVPGLVCGYATAMLLVNLPLHSLAYSRYRKIEPPEIGQVSQ